MSKPELSTIVPVERVLELAKRAPVFPCRRADLNLGGRVLKAKSPLTKNGFKDATQDEQQIRRWWAEHPEALVGVPTGHRTGLVVVDFDTGAAGHATQEWLAENQQALTATRIHQTGGGGRHYLFRLPPNVRIRGGVSVPLGKVVRPGLDIRAEGGYIIWWPLHTAQRGELTEAAPLPAGLLDARRMDLELPPELAKRLPPKPGTSQDFQRDLPRLTEALPFVDPEVYDAWLMVGMALSATTFVVVLSAVGRVVPDAQRSLAFGLVTAGGSLGQFAVVPLAQGLVGAFDWRIALWILSALIAFIALLAFGLPGRLRRGASAPVVEGPELGEALRCASTSSA